MLATAGTTATAKFQQTDGMLATAVTPATAKFQQTPGLLTTAGTPATAKFQQNSRNANYCRDASNIRNSRKNTQECHQ
jgi:hypothetical protein